MKTFENLEENDFELKDLWEIIRRYKFFIAFSSFLFLLVATIYLYSEQSIYRSYSIIEVKESGKKNTIVTDDLLKNAFYATDKEIAKEIEILKTYAMNKKVIEKMNFKTQFFLHKNYKKYELYGNEIPIGIDKIKILKNEILGMEIKFYPHDNEYSIEIEVSKKDKLISDVFKKKLLTLDNKKMYAYGKLIKTDYFELSIHKIKNIDEPIYFKINGNSRNIYESIVKNVLVVKQLNKETSLIEISYADSIPERATDYINNLVNIFLGEEQSTKDKRSNKILKFIEEQLKNVQAKLKNSEKKLSNYKVTNNIINVSAQSSTMIDKLSNIKVKISEKNLKNLLINNALQIIHNSDDFDSIGTIFTSLGDKGILIQLDSLYKLKLEERELQVEYTNEYPQLIKVQQQIESIKNNILQNIKNLKLSTEYEISNLKAQKMDYEKNLLTFPKKEIMLINLKSKYDVNSKMYMYLLKQKSEKKMTNVVAISDYKVIEKAYIPKSAINAKRPMTMLSFCFLGFIVGIILATIFNSLSNKIRDIKDIKHSSKWLFCMEVPFLKNQKIEVFEQPQSIFAESYRKLRTDLQFSSQSISANKSSVVLITSTVEKEGKNLVLINLSAIFQLAGYKSIVIDLDLRNPVLHKYFDIDYDIGISSYLSGKVDINDIVFPTKEPNLDIISVGTIPVNPSELLLSSRLPILFNKLRIEYDYIFINTSPIGLYTDTFSLMHYSDINLFILRKSYSHKSYISKLEEIMIKYNLNNVGLIINGV